MKHIIEFFIGYVLIRGVAAPMATNVFKKYFMNPILRFITRDFIKTERELAIWVHRRNLALNPNHNHTKKSKR